MMDKDGMDIAGRFFSDLAESKDTFVVFTETEDMVDAAKQMVDLAGARVEIQMHKSEVLISKEEAKEYIANFGTPGNCNQHIIQFDDLGVKWTLWMEEYLLIDGNDMIDVLSFC